jgi:predicted 3'-5' exonuclease similar to PolB exonuclease domain
MSKIKNNGFVDAASIVDGSEPIRFNGDVVFDIETGPLASDAEDGSLLNPETARVAAIGYYDPSGQRVVICYDKNEAAMLRQFWTIYLSVNGARAAMIGFNSHGFDLPFIVRRCWFHGVLIPKNIHSFGGKFCDTFVDLMILWKCGSFKDFISLDSLARFLGAGEKVGSGERFHRLWQTDRKAAIDYLVNDVKITHGCAAKMGLVAQSA